MAKCKYTLKIVTRSKQIFNTNVDKLSFDFKEFDFKSKNPFWVEGNPNFYINPAHIESITITEN